MMIETRAVTADGLKAVRKYPGNQLRKPVRGFDETLSAFAVMKVAKANQT